MNDVRTLLAIDGGNSKTDVVLATERGDLLARVRGPGSSPHHLGTSNALRLLDDLVKWAWESAGYEPGIKADRAEVYLAGADLPDEVVVLHEAVDAAGWAAESVVGNDALALLRAGAEAPDAVAVVCGAGINCVGRTSDGRSAAFPSLGRTTGDWGGGRDLGYEALWHAARAEDGRGAPTGLTGAVPSAFGLSTVADVGSAMHFGDIAEDRVIELAPVLFSVAASGDTVAEGVVDRLVAELTVLAEVALDRLGLRGAGAPVVLGGGVIRAQHAVLEPAVRRRLRAVAPSARLTVVTDPPVLGAALSGLDAFAADATAKERLAAAGWSEWKG